MELRVLSRWISHLDVFVADDLAPAVATVLRIGGKRYVLTWDRPFFARFAVPVNGQVDLVGDSILCDLVAYQCRCC